MAEESTTRVRVTTYLDSGEACAAPERLAEERG